MAANDGVHDTQERPDTDSEHEFRAYARGRVVANDGVHDTQEWPDTDSEHEFRAYARGRVAANDGVHDTQELPDTDSEHEFRAYNVHRRPYAGESDGEHAHHVYRAPEWPADYGAHTDNRQRNMQEWPIAGREREHPVFNMQGPGNIMSF